MNSALDTLAGVSLGGFLLTVAIKGNTTALIDLAKRDRSFLQWAIAVGVLVYLYKQPALKGVASMLIVLAFVGLGLVSGDNIIKYGKSFWSSLGSE